MSVLTVARKLPWHKASHSSRTAKYRIGGKDRKYSHAILFSLGKENLTKTHPPRLLFTSVLARTGSPAYPRPITDKEEKLGPFKKTSRHDPFAGPGQVAVLNIIRRISIKKTEGVTG